MLALYTLPLGGASTSKFNLARNPLSYGAASAAFVKLAAGGDDQDYSHLSDPAKMKDLFVYKDRGPLNRGASDHKGNAQA